MNPPYKTPFSDLKRNYLICFESCLILSLLAFIGLFRLNLPGQSPKSDFTIPAQEILSVDFIPSSIYAPAIPESPSKVIIPVDPVPDIILEEQLRDLDIEHTALNRSLAIANKKGSTGPKTDQESIGNYLTESMPFLIGGVGELQKRIKYPSKAVKDKVEGRVVVQFIVDRNGKVRNPEVIKGVRYDLNREALRAVSKSRFLPGQVDDKTVPTEQVLHIVFKIEYNS